MMKKNILVFMSCCVLSFSMAQAITFDEVDLPEVGYTYVVAADTTTSVIITAPSASAQNWDYSSLLLHYLKVPTYDSTNNTPYQADFAASTHYTYGPAAFYSGFHGGAPVGTQGMNNGYMFWRRDDTGFWIVGFRADEGDYANKNVLLLEQELLIGVPVTYNDVYNNTARWELEFNLNASNADTLYVNNVEKVLTADAFGSLITPTGTFPDVLRIHEYVITSDSAYAEFMSTPVYALEIKRDTLNNYLFLDNNTHYPVCTIHADKNNDVVFVEYYHAYSMAGVDDKEMEMSFVYPNPSAGIVNFTLPSDQPASYQIIISDLSGRCVQHIRLNPGNSVCQVNLTAGMYVYTIVNGTKITENGKLIITD